MFMRSRTLHLFVGTALCLLAVAACSATAENHEQITTLPAPKTDAPLAQHPASRSAVFSGGCFWGMQWVFEHVKGVQNVASGYSGGSARTAHYDIVSGGNTGHAESIRVRYDPSKVSYGKLLQVMFSVATDPTQLNRQGPDVGTQYRSVIFYTTPKQRKIANHYIAQLTRAKVYGNPIVTKVQPFKAFYPAESYHQDYARRNPHALYIAINDAPKVAALRNKFPEIYRNQAVHYQP